MAIEIEDGTGKEEGLSFATAAELVAFADARGLTYPATGPEQEKLLVQAGDFLLGLEHQYKGSRSTATQRLPYPRCGVYLYGGQALAQNAIPGRLKEAQIRLAISANTITLRPDGTGREVVRKKTGPLETEYAKQGSGSVDPVFNSAMDLLSPFLKSISLTVTRA